MRIPTPEDFRKIREWGVIENPLAAIDEFKPQHEEKRWENEWHCRASEEYKEGREESYRDYYNSEMERPIDRTKWEFLKLRKAWYIPPLGWDNFARPGVTRILDLGCGDGDVVQRVAEHIAGQWKKTGYNGFPLEIIGVDLNEKRIENAKKLCKSPHPKITLSFETGDAVSGLEFTDNYFNYSLATGVFEIIPGENGVKALDEMCRVTANGIYIQDMLDKHPGGNPRPELKEKIEKQGFEDVERHKVLGQPFVEEGTKDPLEVWPMSLNQIIFAHSRTQKQVTDVFAEREKRKKTKN